MKVQGDWNLRERTKSAVGSESGIERKVAGHEPRQVGKNGKGERPESSTGKALSAVGREKKARQPRPKCSFTLVLALVHVHLRCLGAPLGDHRCIVRDAHFYVFEFNHGIKLLGSIRYLSFPQSRMFVARETRNIQTRTGCQGFSKSHHDS